MWRTWTHYQDWIISLSYLFLSAFLGFCEYLKDNRFPLPPPIPSTILSCYTFLQRTPQLLTSETRTDTNTLKRSRKRMKTSVPLEEVQRAVLRKSLSQNRVSFWWSQMALFAHNNSTCWFSHFCHVNAPLNKWSSPAAAKWGCSSVWWGWEITCI